MGSAFHQLCPRYSGTLTPTALKAIRLWETFTLTVHKILILAGKTGLRLHGCRSIFETLVKVF